LRRLLLLGMAVLLVTLLLATAADARPHTDHLSRYGGKLTVTATYHPKSNQTVCDLRDKRIKKKAADPNLWHNRWRVKGKSSAEDCLRAWIQQ
jgi:hypothetical protein